jgi:type II secretory pathway component PulK
MIRHYQKGIVLVIVLWLIVVLSAIAVGFGHSMLVEYRIMRNQTDKMISKELAKSGIENAIAILANDSTEAGALTSPWRIGESETWITELGDGNFTLFNNIPEEEDNDKISYGIVDENSKININTAPKSVLLKLPNVDEIIADSIIDWRSATATTSQYGAKDEYYTQLNPPYNCKNGPFDTIEELLLVKGITPAILYGEDANLNGILDTNENDGDETFPSDDSDGKLDQGLYPYITVYSSDLNRSISGKERIYLPSARYSDLQKLSSYGLTTRDIVNLSDYLNSHRETRSLGDLLDANGMTMAKLGAIADYVTFSRASSISGLVNVNTAPKVVLQALPGMDETKADALIQRRSGSEGAFKNVGEAGTVLGKETFKKVVDYITVRSSQFTIQSLGRLNNKKAYTRLMVVVDRYKLPIKPLYYRDISFLGQGIYP